MAFERPIEADRVEDLGLFSSFLRAPVVGTILWLLGGEDAKKAEEEDRRRSESEGESHEAESFRDDELKTHDRGKREGAPTEPWPQISTALDSDEDELHHDFPSYEKFVTSEISTPEPSSHLLGADSSGPASRVVDELVAVMDASSLDDKGGMKRRSPRRNSSQINLASLDTEGAADADESVSDKKVQDTRRPSSRTKNQLSSSITKKKMSWSDETGEQPLVEYFDDTSHSSRFRRNSWKPSRSCSFDSQDKMSSKSVSRGGRSKVRVIKSALKRSGSYSPPLPVFGSSSSGSESNSSNSSQHSSFSGMKSCRSLSVVGSTDSEDNRSDSPFESRHVPSSLQVGCGRASGGLIIPTGGPGGFPGYQLTLGTAAPLSKTDTTTSEGQAEESKSLTPNSEGTSSASNPPPSMHHFHNNRHSSNPQHFLPHHSNGYISPQYGFYVNITPPTPEMFYPRPPPGSFSDKSKDPVQQQSYQQFAKQQKPFRPSPIPEVTTASPHPERKAPMQPVFTDASPRGTPRESVKKSIKPAFIKNKPMGMFLSENPHQVWPTVPFG